jgi:hypothetical protein
MRYLITSAALGKPPRPFSLLVGRDKPRLRLQPGNIGRIIRSHQPVDERAGARLLLPVP